MRVCDFLRTHGAAVVAEWERRVRPLPHARQLPPPALRNQIPELLLRLSEWLKHGATRERAEALETTAAEHALTRLDQGVDLRQVVTELRLLRASIFQLYCAVAPSEVTAVFHELGRLNDALDFAAADAVNRYLEARERALRESEARFRALVDNSPAAIYVKDPAGRYLLANRRVEAIFGRPRAEILGKSDAEILPEALATALRENDRNVLANNAPAELEESFLQESEPHTYL
jgi:PAS domain-containing protein